MTAFRPISIQIETEQEADALLKILDAAARYGGINTAPACAVFLSKFQSAQMINASLAKKPLGIDEPEEEKA